MKVCELLENEDWEEDPEMISITNDEEYDQVERKIKALRHEEQLLYKQYQKLARTGSSAEKRVRNKIDTIVLRTRRLNQLRQDFLNSIQLTKY